MNPHRRTFQRSAYFIVRSQDVEFEDSVVFALRLWPKNIYFNVNVSGCQPSWSEIKQC